MPHTKWVRYCCDGRCLERQGRGPCEGPRCPLDKDLESERTDWIYAIIVAAVCLASGLGLIAYVLGRWPG